MKTFPEELLKSLTVWDGPEPELWRTAQRLTRPVVRSSRPSGSSRWRVVLVGLSAVALVAVIVSLSTSSLLRDREPRYTAALSSLDRVKRQASAEVAMPLSVAMEAAPSESFSDPTAGTLPPAKSRPARRAAFDATAEPRKVIRKATLELQTPDVRAAFLKALHLPSEAEYEYVEESALTGRDREMQGTLMLRVRADRLDRVLGELRQLGDVTAEQSRGEDVTTQVVDLDARLRNEERVEAELLDLLERRKEAPLSEILELRHRIAEVRERIEQMTSQQQRLARLVDLATILVIIRTGQATPAGFDFGDYAGESVRAAWRTGVTTLVDTLAALLRIVVGGLLWWLLLALIVAVVVRRLRRARAARNE